MYVYIFPRACTASIPLRTLNSTDTDTYRKTQETVSTKKACKAFQQLSKLSRSYILLWRKEAVQFRTQTIIDENCLLLQGR